jgi:hypothetical protein
MISGLDGTLEGIASPLISSFSALFESFKYSATYQFNCATVTFSSNELRATFLFMISSNGLFERRQSVTHQCNARQENGRLISDVHFTSGVQFARYEAH